jgi:hypothetical protein
MNALLRLFLAVAASSFWPSCARAEVVPSSAVQNRGFEFSHFLRHRPLDLSQLLGKHFSLVVPGAVWASLPIPEEYKDRAIKYGKFVGGKNLRDYMKSWDFMTDSYCVSRESMFLLFFNRGFVFKVELRYLPDSFRGAISSDDPEFCADEAPIFRMIAKKLGGSGIVRQGSHELTQYTTKYVLKLGTSVNAAAGLSWELRGGPSLPKL